MSAPSLDLFIPPVDPTYVPWGCHDQLAKVIKSAQFFPPFIAGPSGTGKSIMVEQICAALGREYVRIQITPETDEDSLIGGFRLVNGDTVFHEGPVLKAMKAGAVCLIDEMDRGTNKIMCLQGVMEGKPVLVKRTGEIVYPSPGFNIIATGNTKGRGSEDGKYIAATIIDDAFLERFPIMFDHYYPSTEVETKIVHNHMDKYGCYDESTLEALVRWGQKTRDNAKDDGDDRISTRRLCHIVQTLSIMGGDDDAAVEMCVNRYDTENSLAFVQFYKAIKPEIAAAKAAAARTAKLNESSAERKEDAEAVAKRVLQQHYSTKYKP